MDTEEFSRGQLSQTIPLNHSKLRESLNAPIPMYRGKANLNYAALINLRKFELSFHTGRHPAEDGKKKLSENNRSPDHQ